MYSKTLLPILCATVISCNAGNEPDTSVKRPVIGSDSNSYISVNTIPVPAGYTRILCDSNSFSCWLRNIHLKKDKTVYLFNGDKKNDQSVQFAVLDISTGDKDLQQCADAVMRLRAEYLFHSKRYAEIIFYDNENGKYEFTEPYTRQHFSSYLERVFGMCGSASLSKQLHNTDINNIQPGDVFIRGGFPGHAEIVMDVAVNDATGKKIFLLAQSYMPAQDIHIVRNPLNKALSPWYEVEENIVSPEYVFTKNELKTW